MLLFSFKTKLFMPNSTFAPSHPKKNQMGPTDPQQAQWWLFAICGTVIGCSCAWWKIFEKSKKAGEAGWSLFHLCIGFFPLRHVWLQKRCAAPCPEPSCSAAAGHPRLYHSPVTPAQACQLNVINAAGILRGSISTLHTAVNALKKIQRKCKAMSLHGSTLGSANSVERRGADRYSELPSGNPSFTLLTV